MATEILVLVLVVLLLIVLLVVLVLLMALVVVIAPTQKTAHNFDWLIKCTHDYIEIINFFYKNSKGVWMAQQI